MNIDKNIIEYLSKKYNNLRKVNEFAYRSHSHTLRFYDDKNKRDISDKNINNIMLSLHNSEYKPIDKLSFVSQNIYISVYKTKI